MHKPFAGLDTLTADYFKNGILHPMNLTILHTNDLHGHVDELAVLTTMARRIRREVEAAGCPMRSWPAKRWTRLARIVWQAAMRR